MHGRIPISRHSSSDMSDAGRWRLVSSNQGYVSGGGGPVRFDDVDARLLRLLDSAKPAIA
ncbi:hypothetical protein [Saccharothrix ecbatanensis]|uniref:hypothetical protein n=1 Tax=Saccharothrix ecbatanensis TaxID=1105145 RepID=UPI00160C6154|nr:hypothetical protein [Saccharothrix ecbatanensis]